ncbi:MAG: hypothetical protein JNK85_13250 [Verrucomicrobiales bacterium]|nr:hypothetical protein [Verrucomicrobiales bacterium]
MAPQSLGDHHKSNTVTPLKLAASRLDPHRILPGRNSGSFWRVPGERSHAYLWPAVWDFDKTVQSIEDSKHATSKRQTPDGWILDLGISIETYGRLPGWKDLALTGVT